MGLFDILKRKEEVKPASSKVSLIKEREEKVTISLKKKTDEEIIAKVNLIIDVSGSMTGLFYNGTVQNIVERIYPIASKFDDNKELDMWLFSNNYKSLKAVTIDNFEGYVKKEIINKDLIGGGTSYSPVMQAVCDQNKKTLYPVYNIFITDGDNSDHYETERLIIEASRKPLFWQFIGIGYESFEFLKRLDGLSGRVVDNANFFQLNDIDKVSDEELYDRLLNEFPSWLKEIKAKNI